MEYVKEMMNVRILKYAAVIVYSRIFGKSHNTAQATSSHIFVLRIRFASRAVQKQQICDGHFVTVTGTILGT